VPLCTEFQQKGTTGRDTSRSKPQTSSEEIAQQCARILQGVAEVEKPFEVLEVDKDQKG
jgi:hypothetical protein